MLEADRLQAVHMVNDKANSLLAEGAIVDDI